MTATTRTCRRRTTRRGALPSGMSAGLQFFRGVRPTSIRYPSGNSVVFGYNDVVGRLDTISWDGPGLLDMERPIGRYQYLGESDVFRVLLPRTGGLLTASAGWDQTMGGQHAFAGLDMFDRQRESAWYAGTLLNHYRYEHTSSGAQTSREDLLAQGAGLGLDEVYARDRVDRLTGLTRCKTRRLQNNVLQIRRGTETFAQNFSRDAQGNPRQFQEWRAASSGPPFNGRNHQVRQQRRYTPDGEIASLTPNNGGCPVPLTWHGFSNMEWDEFTHQEWHLFRSELTDAWGVPKYDPAGNMIDVPQPANPRQCFQCQYDLSFEYTPFIT